MRQKKKNTTIFHLQIVISMVVKITGYCMGGLTLLVNLKSVSLYVYNR